MNSDDLLRKYNPVLVILPRDVTLHRPWSRWYQTVTRPRGDYHPCSAQFFLTYVTQRSGKRAWSATSMTEESLPEPTGLEQLRSLVEAARPGEAADWEIDVAPVKSRDPDQAWAAYGVMLERSAAISPQVAYGWYVPGPHPVLEYWYLYVYNDAPNKHEGDWEMVLLELDENGEPLRAGYSGHAGGFARPWSAVEKQDGRPVVYVARGSHAAYFDHDPNGHRANSLPGRKGLPEPFESLWESLTKAVQDATLLLRLQDRTVARGADTTVEPDLVVLPAMEGPALPSDFWWMRLDCAWGSSHLRFFGSAAPDPPWKQLKKWNEPLEWLKDLAPG